MENYSSDSYVNNGLENVAMPTGSNDAALMTSLLSQALARMKVDVAPPSSPLKTVQRRSLDSPLIAARATSDGTLTPVSPPSPPTAARQGMCWAEFQAHLKAWVIELMLMHTDGSRPLKRLPLLTAPT